MQAFLISAILDLIPLAVFSEEYISHPGRETVHSPPSNAEVKGRLELYPTRPTRLHGVVLS